MTSTETTEIKVGLSSRGKTYVAYLLDLDNRYGFDRAFENGVIQGKSWSRSGKTGSAHVNVAELADGVYEVQSMRTWTDKTRRYYSVAGGKATEISEAEAREEVA